MSILETRDLRKFYGAGDAQVRALDGAAAGDFVHGVTVQGQRSQIGGPPR